eukprot:1592230-Rhodomonas_salina.1
MQPFWSVRQHEPSQWRLWCEVSGSARFCRTRLLIDGKKLRCSGRVNNRLQKAMKASPLSSYHRYTCPPQRRCRNLSPLSFIL